MTPQLLTEVMLKQALCACTGSPVGVEDKDRKPQDQLKLPISLLNLQGTTVGQQLLDLACLGVEAPP